MKRLLIVLLALGLLGASTPDATAKKKPKLRLTTASRTEPGQGSNVTASGLSASPNGRFLVVLTADPTQLVPGVVHTNGIQSDALLFDRTRRRFSLINHIPGDPLTTTSIGVSLAFAAVGNDGSVFFQSDADAVEGGEDAELVEGFVDNNGDVGCPESCDVFRYRAGKNTLVTGRQGSPTQGANGGIGGFFGLAPTSLSANGRRLVLQSFATDLISTATPVVNNGTGCPFQLGVPGTDPCPVTYLKDMKTGKVSLVNQKAGMPNHTSEGINVLASISAAGNTISLLGDMDDLVAGAAADPKDPSVPDVYVYDVKKKRMRLASHTFGASGTPANGTSVTIGRPSPNGRFVAITSDAPDIIDPGTFVNANADDCPDADDETNPVEMLVDCPDVYRYDVRKQTLILVNHKAASPTTTGDEAGTLGLPLSNGDVIFASLATDHLTLKEGESFTDNNTSEADCPDPFDVEFPIDPGNCPDVFVRRAKTKRISLVAHAHNDVNATPDANSLGLLFGAGFGALNGKAIAFPSHAQNLVSGFVDLDPAVPDVFLWTAKGNRQTLLSKDLDAAVPTGAGLSAGVAQSSSGSVVYFGSISDQLVAPFTPEGPPVPNIYDWGR